MDRDISPTIKALMYAMGAGYVLQHFVVSGGMIEQFGLVPARVVHDFWLWQLVTYLFLHGSLFHLLFNLFALWLFGRLVEQSWGSREFLKYCVICGVGAGLVNIAFTPHSMNPIIGASGAIYGLLVAVAMLYPDATFYAYFFIPMKARHAVILFAIIEFITGATHSGGNIANFAHLGGMVTGYLYIRWWWELKARVKRLFSGVWERVSEGSTRRPQWRRPRKGEPSPMDLSTEVDRILDKILLQGVDSLTPEEKDTMKKYSKKHKHDA